MKKISFPFGETQIELNLAVNTPVKLLEPRDAGISGDPQSEIARALREPNGAPPLAKLAKGKKNAVIIVSDRSRLAPTQLFLPCLIDELSESGLRINDITVVVAVGAHRRVTEQEIVEIVGPDVYGRVKCLSSSPEPEECVTLGHTSRGTPVRIYRAVAEGELKVATGNIEPHLMASFSGGAKAVLPGCAALAAIEKNHALSLLDGQGQTTGENPVRADAEEAARLAGLDFIFNVVVDRHGRLLRAFAGHPVRAHREGCRLAGQVYQVELAEPADLVVASAGGFPKDQNLYQAVKALQNAAAAVRPGGTVVMAACCREGYGNETFQRWVESGFSGKRARERLARGFELGGHKAAYAAEITDKCRVYFVSELAGNEVELLQFRPFPDLQEAFEAARSGFPGGAPRVLALPYAGLTFPV